MSTVSNSQETVTVTIIPCSTTESSSPSQVQVRPNWPLLPQLLSKGVEIKSSCGGQGVCTDCVVKVESGREFCSFLTQAEQQKLGNVTHLTFERLSCQLTIVGPITLDLSSQAHVKRAKRRTSTPSLRTEASSDQTIKLRKASSKPRRQSVDPQHHPITSDLQPLKTSSSFEAATDDYQWKRGGLKRPKRS